MKKTIILSIFLLLHFMNANAQFGYQISLLDASTGEPRANETVTVSISLSNSANEVFYSESKSSTTNDFGILSLTIGNADTFKNVDLSKMPFFVEVSANNVMIGKSQILSVPLAEVAKRIVPMDKQSIIGTWYNTADNSYFYTINSDGTINYTASSTVYTGNYIIYGDFLIVDWENSTSGGFNIEFIDHYIIPIINNKLLGCGIGGRVQNNTYQK
jgi:hypothetical protein